ncbi:hypothetical protein CHUAL_006722 [Chamberlinius hualienensis]
MLWSIHGAPLLHMDDEINYSKVVTIGQTIFLFGKDKRSKFRIIEIDAKTFQYSEFVPIANERILDKTGPLDTICEYLHYILIINYRLSTLLKIDTNSRESEEIELEMNDLNLVTIYQSCTINDQLFLFSFDMDGSEISALNLKTFKWTLNNFKNESTPHHFLWVNTKIYGDDIYCFSGIVCDFKQYDVFVFNTLNNQWTRIIRNCNRKVVICFFGVINGNELIMGQKGIDENNEMVRFLEILNLETKQWRISWCPYNDDMFNIPFYENRIINDKIFVFDYIWNSSFYYFTRHGSVYNEVKQFRYKIRVFHLKPSLQTMCELFINKHKLNTSKLPKKIQIKILSLKRFAHEWCQT